MNRTSVPGRKQPNHPPRGRLLGDTRVGNAALAVLLLALAVLAYLPAISAGPVWDDHLLLEQNPTIAGRTPALEAFRQPFTPFDLFYRPATAIALRAAVAPETAAVPGSASAIPGIAVSAGSEGTTGSLRTIHVVALALHSLIGLAIAQLAKRSGASPLAAGFAAVVFVCHPAMTEAVAWMSGFGDVLAGFALVFAALLALPAVGPASLGRPPRSGGGEPGPARGESSPRGLVLRSAAAVFLLALSAFAKETAVPIAILIVSAALWHRFRSQTGEARRTRAVIVSAGFAVVLIAYAALRASAVPPGGLEPRFEISRAVLVLGTYVRTWLFPIGEGFAPILDLHPLVNRPEGLDVRYLWAAGGTVTFCAMSWIAWRRRSPARFGLLWAAVSFVPAWLLVPASSPLLAERYLYLPSIGLAIAVPALMSGALGWGRGGAPWNVARSDARGGRALRASAIVVAILLCLSALAVTRMRANEWKSEETLLEASLARDARNVAIAVNRGFLLRSEGRPDQALSLYRRTISAIDQGRPFYQTDHGRIAWTRLLFEAGTLELESGAREDAEADWRRALEVDPLHEQTLISYSALLGSEARFDELVGLLDPAVSALPESIPLRRNLALGLRLSGKDRAAVEQYRALLRLDPNDSSAREALERLDRP